MCEHGHGKCLKAAIVFPLLAFGTIAMAPLDALAQERIRGRIPEAGTRRPLQGVGVQIARGDTLLVASTQTDSTGSFRVGIEEPGVYRLQAHQFGYRIGTSASFEVPADQTVDVVFELRPQPVEIEGLEVTGDGRMRGRDIFADRRARGEGVFLDRGQIDSIAPRETGDLFSHVDGVRLRWRMSNTDSGDRRLIPDVISSYGRGCMVYAVDDTPLLGRRRGNPWNRYPLSSLEPDDIMAVEVYRYLSEAPPELRNSAWAPVGGTSVVQVPGQGRAQVAGTVRTPVYEEKTCGITVFRTKERW